MLLIMLAIIFFPSRLFKSGRVYFILMGTQMSSARRGVATDEMKQVAKDEDVSLEWLISKIAKSNPISEYRILNIE